MSDTPKHILPHGWAFATISDCIGPQGVFIDGDWVESKDQDPAGDVRLIQLADVGDGAYRDRSARFLTRSKAAELRCTFLQPGDVLIARMPDPLGRACIFPGDERPAVTVVDVCVVRSGAEGVEHRWLMWAVNSPAFRTEVAALQSGSTRKRISRGNLAGLQLPIPPRQEQVRIVVAVEEQISRIESAVSGLKRVRANLKRYRASVLKAACEGRLVPTEAELARQEDRKYEPADALLARLSGPDTYPAAVQDTSAGADMPVGWAWATVEQLAASEKHSITDGPFGSKLKTEHYVSSGPRVVRLQNIGDGVFVDERAHISNDHFASLRKHEVFAGDIVIATLGSRPPRAAVVPSGLGPAIVKADCIRFKPAPGVLLATYANIALNAEPTRSRMASIVHGVGRPRLNLSEIKAIMIPLPPLAEQERIVAEVERRLTTLDKLEAEVERGLRRAERLRQAILKRAFEGKLVPQDSGDEPASILLERIRAARAATPTTTRTRRRTTTGP